ncbi:response regulator transcription factor [Paenibacillus timonensis]|jgi:DNA-binding NarL/FixJ family response regulator|uniref:Response regulator n=1 Tax=Paenibacillus timonensis TaxID=225915 RepID=A0ABW3S7K0_9BACL|nr:response regulator transcription factor [Paenibacillus timonensis]MCH1641301.1 response regulator transcription factor [Paenibacillus timonensis]GJM83523.1 DNA-binding response regulator [Paenibacillus sp. HMSSN-139]
MKIRVLIADDNSFIREGMRIILNSFEEFEVAETVQDGQEAVDYCRQHPVDVALLDVRMPNLNGVEATRLLTEEGLAKPLILTTFDDDEYIMDAIRFGAKGYLLKNNDPERIRDAIKSVHYGHNVLQDVVLDKLKQSLTAGGASKEEGAQPKPESAGARVDFPAPALHSPAAPASEGSRPPIDLEPFTERELEVMSRIAKGLSNKEIAKEIFISEGTVANYITSILNKTGLEHRTQIAIYYLTGRIR